MSAFLEDFRRIVISILEDLTEKLRECNPYHFEEIIAARPKIVRLQSLVEAYFLSDRPKDFSVEVIREIREIQKYFDTKMMESGKNEQVADPTTTGRVIPAVTLTYLWYDTKWCLARNAIEAIRAHAAAVT